MATIHQVKQRAVTDTPLLLFRCELPDGEIRRWCTHEVTVSGEIYEARVQQHNWFELRALGEDGADGLGKMVLRLADVDGTLVQMERAVGFKGAKLRVNFVFYDLAAGSATTDPITVFLGLANAPEEITESSVRLSFVNRMNMQRSYLPTMRIQRRCPWSFPATSEQREAAADTNDPYQRWNRCGYSADVTGGMGTLNGASPFTSCDYSRANCEERGMFKIDSAGRETKRFGGLDFVPANITVRSFGEAGSHVSYTQENEARFNDVVPLVYGTAWYFPPVIFARNDGNLTHMEVLLGAGVIDGVEKVVVNDTEILAGNAGATAATGWYNLVSAGELKGSFNPDFADAQGNALGDPHGGMAVLSVAVPNQVVQSGRLPKVQVLLRGVQVPTYDASGAIVGQQFTNNPAWVLLDVLRRSGWQAAEVDLPAFATVAARCSDQVIVLNAEAQQLLRPRMQCNLVVRKRTSVADLVRGICTGAGLVLAFGSGGKLTVKAEADLATQQPSKPAGSNSLEALTGGWPAYEFGDGTDGWTDILRLANGEPSLRFWSRSTAELPNRYGLEFQDELNSYQQDSLSLVDSEDAARAGQEISATLPALGVANYRQAAQVAGTRLRKTLYGNLFAQFQTSCRGLLLSPGDLITLTYPRLGLSRQLFRIQTIAPGVNFSAVAITAQLHEDEWYTVPVVDAYGGGGRPGSFASGLPRPLVGAEIDAAGNQRWKVEQTDLDAANTTARVQAGFTVPRAHGSSALRTPTLAATPNVINGGTLAGGAQYFYAVSGVDANGIEGPLSSVIAVRIPSGQSGSSVRLTGLSFGPGAQGSRVYRGSSSQRLLLIAAESSVAETFVDAGGPASLEGPPDYNFDHSNFYWRWESLPETTATSWGAYSIGNDGLSMSNNAYRGQLVRLESGKGAGQERAITGNGVSSFAIDPAWDVTPDGTTKFAVVEAAWRLGATTRTSPATWDMPFREGATVHVLGRAANVRNEEDSYALATQTRWQMGVGQGGDVGVPRRPVFGMTTQGRGTLDLSGIAFSTLANTGSITSGTLAVHYVDELDPSTWSVLGAAINDTDETLSVAGLSVSVGNLLQIDKEIVVVLSADAESGTMQVSRGEKSSTAVVHANGTRIFLLKRKMMILAFSPGFFGSPASGDYLHTIALPATRVAEADLFVTNRLGNSETGNALFTDTTDLGLRTLVGGQFSLTIEGFLGLQDDAALPVVLDQTYAVGAVYALVAEAPTGSPIEIRLNVNGDEYSTLTIPVGSTVSDVISGFGKTPLPQGGKLTVDITGVSTDPGEYPGRDLTVVVEV